MDHRRLALWLALATLCLRLLVPAGFMPTVAGGSVTLSICTGMGARTMTVVGVVPGVPARDPAQDDASKGHKAQMPCAFAGLGLASLAAVDPVLLVAATAFVMATGLAVTRDAPKMRRVHLRPPLRGPPATI